MTAVSAATLAAPAVPPRIHAGLALLRTVLGAIFIAHLSAGFFAPNGYEFPLTLVAGLAAIALIGPGGYSLDAMISRRRAGGPSAA